MVFIEVVVKEPQTLDFGCVKTVEEWINIQQRMIYSVEDLPDNLPKLRKKGDFFILSWDREQDMMMFLLRWS